MFSTGSFYNTTTPPRGSTKKEFLHRLKKRKKVEERAESYKASPLSDLQRYVKIFSERKVWKWFSRQQEALDYCSGMREDCLRLFAYEKTDGKRRFLVTTVKQFWNKYAMMNEMDKHFYEVIALHHTCRLYFDIEFERELNPGLDGVAALDTFIHYVCHCISLEYNIHCSRKHVVDLDSSTEVKFSRHLIFHLSGAVFIDNISAGLFVKDLCSCLKCYIESGNKNKFLPVQNFQARERTETTGGCTNTGECATKATTTTIMAENADTAAITESTCSARSEVCKSSKSETETVVSPAETKSSASLHDDDVLRWEDNLNNLLVESTNGKTFLCDLAVYTKHRNFRLYQSSKVSKKVPLVVAKENEYMFAEKLTRNERNMYRNRGEVFDPAFRKFTDTLIGDTQRNVRMLSYGDGAVSKKRCFPRPLKEGSKSTPYPDLDVFVMGHVKRFCNRGVIRRWLLFDHSKILVYDIDDNHWCGNINREHKSNHVYYIADLKFKVLYQKCFDPDCVNYRSPDTPIPDNVNPVVEDLDIEEFDVSCDAELNRLFSDDITVDGLDPVIDLQKDGMNCNTSCNKESCKSDDNNASNSSNHANSWNGNIRNNTSSSICSGSNESGFSDMSDEELSLLFCNDMEMDMIKLPGDHEELLDKQHTEKIINSDSTGLSSNNELIRSSVDGVDGVDLIDFFQDDVFNIDELCSCGNKEDATRNHPTPDHVNNLFALEHESNTSINEQCVPKRLSSEIPSDIKNGSELNKSDLSYDLFAEDPSNLNSGDNTKEDSDVISDAELSKVFDEEGCELLISTSGSECVAALAVQQNSSMLDHNSNKENREIDSHNNEKCREHGPTDKFDCSKDLSSFLIDMTPLKQRSDNKEMFDGSGADLFSPSASQPLVSTRRRPSRPTCKPKIAPTCQSFSCDNSFTGGMKSKEKNVENRSELDSATLNRIFSGDDPDNEFSLII